jgi:hypothetical protein
MEDENFPYSFRGLKVKALKKELDKVNYLIKKAPKAYYYNDYMGLLRDIEIQRCYYANEGTE